MPLGALSWIPPEISIGNFSTISFESSSCNFSGSFFLPRGLPPEVSAGILTGVPSEIPLEILSIISLSISLKIHVVNSPEYYRAFVRESASFFESFSGNFQRNSSGTFLGVPSRVPSGFVFQKLLRKFLLEVFWNVFLNSSENSQKNKSENSYGWFTGVFSGFFLMLLTTTLPSPKEPQKLFRELLWNFLRKVCWTFFYQKFLWKNFWEFLQALLIEFLHFTACELVTNYQIILMDQQICVRENSSNMEDDHCCAHNRIQATLPLMLGFLLPLEISIISSYLYPVR